MQPCESQGYVVDNGMVLGIGSNKISPFLAASAAQAAALRQIRAAASSAIKTNRETCQRGCKRSYRIDVTPIPAAGPGDPLSGWTLQMGMLWVLFMDCRKSPAAQPSIPIPPKPGRIYVDGVRAEQPIPRQIGRIQVRVVGED